MNAPYTWTGNCCSVINTEPKPKVGTPPPVFHLFSTIYLWSQIKELLIYFSMKSSLIHSIIILYFRDKMNRVCLCK